MNYRKLFFNTLQSLQAGSLTLTLPNGQTAHYEGKNEGVKAEIEVRRWEVIDHLITHGDLGLAEDYIEKNWQTSDLLALMRFATANFDVFDRILFSNTWPRLWFWLKHLLSPNTLKRSRENVHAHYDLGNDFYRLWLDESMTYSSALFNGEPARSLNEAQMAKYQRILERLAPAPGSHIVDIGCGWGGFMEQAASQGCTVTGVTLSDEQAQYARQRLESAGLGATTEVRLQDYRELSGSYDYLVSIGMFEHVGEGYWPTFMKDVHDFLKPGGKALIQTITIPEERFDRYKHRSDFLREHIFPGGMLPSRERFVAHARDNQLAVNDVFEFGRDYSLTLEKWLENFEGHLQAIRELGYDDKFIRKWRYYLASCAGMFRAGGLSVMQVELARS